MEYPENLEDRVRYRFCYDGSQVPGKLVPLCLQQTLLMLCFVCIGVPTTLAAFQTFLIGIGTDFDKLTGNEKVAVRAAYDKSIRACKEALKS